MSTIESNLSKAPVDRQLPQNVDAEKAVLGSILLLPEVFQHLEGVVVAPVIHDNDLVVIRHSTHGLLNTGNQFRKALRLIEHWDDNRD